MQSEPEEPPLDQYEVSVQVLRTLETLVDSQNRIERSVAHLCEAFGANPQHASRCETYFPQAPAHGATLSLNMSERADNRCATSLLRFGGSGRRQTRTSLMSLCGLPREWPSTLKLRPEYMSESEGGWQEEKLGNILSHNTSLDKPGRVSSLNMVIRGRMSTCALHPESPVIFVNDLAGIAMIVHDVVLTPVLLAWDITVQGVLLRMAWLSCVYWTVDLVLGFFMGFHRYGELIMQQPYLCQNYLRTTFGLDFLLVVGDWVNLVSSIADAGLVSDSSGVLRLLKVTRLLKVLRVMRLVRVMDKLSSVAHRSTIHILNDVLKVTLGTLFTCHLLTCVWFLIGDVGPTDTGHRWLETAMHDTNADTIRGAEMLYQYTSALHWIIAQLTLGSSDVTPRNGYERVFTIILLLAGVLFGASIVAFLSAQIVQFIMLKQDKTRMIDDVHKFLRQHQVSRSLAVRVTAQVSKRVTEEKMLDDADVSALALLSSTLRVELLHATRMPHLLTHPLFQTWRQLDTRAVHLLCERAIGFTYPLATDAVFIPGPAKSLAYYVVRGQLTYTQLPEFSKVHRETTVDVAEGAWLCEPALWSNWVHVGVLEAETTSHVLSIRGEGLAETLHDCMGAVADITKTYAQNYHLRLCAAMPPHAAWPNDLRVPCCNSSDLMSADMGIALVRHACSNGRLPPEIVHRLEKELRDGLCAVQQAADTGELERVVSLVTIRLGDGEGNTFMQVGKWEANTGVQPKLQLPGSKRPTREMPQAALQRILNSNLGAVAGFAVIEEFTTSVERKESADLGVSTTYLRTEHTATISVAPEDLELQVVPLHQTPEIPSLARILPRDIYGILSGKKTLLYAWLSDHEIRFLQQPATQPSLLEWVSLLQMDGDELRSI